MVSALVREELQRAAVGRPTALTIGVFDGVHRGHRALFQRVVASARSGGLTPGAVTLHPHPRQVIHPGEQIEYITSLEDRLELLRDLGLECVAPVTFTSELAQAEARDFVQLLCDELQMRLLVIGPDFALGRQRGGDEAALRALGDELGYAVEVIDFVPEADGKISSSHIRDSLAGGDMERVAALLGRPFSLYGPVVRGFDRGHSIGFPTANIAVGADRVLPAPGVYATRARVAGEWMRSVTNVGVRPTFDDSDTLSIECHLLDFSGDLYGTDLRIEFLCRLRPERKFADVDALRAQLSEDCEAARKALPA